MIGLQPLKRKRWLQQTEYLLASDGVVSEAIHELVWVRRSAFLFKGGSDGQRVAPQCLKSDSSSSACSTACSHARARPAAQAASKVVSPSSARQRTRSRSRRQGSSGRPLHPPAVIS